jgi:hypothetical protein
VGPRAGLDTEARGNILRPRRGSNPGRPARSQTLYCLSYPAPASGRYTVQISPGTPVVARVSWSYSAIQRNITSLPPDLRVAGSYPAEAMDF